jgi:hypothetical protein
MSYRKLTLDDVEKYLKKNQKQFHKRMEKVRERERKTMERAMTYWIN